MAKHLFIVGPGDVAARALPQLVAGFEVMAMARTHERAAELARLGVQTRVGDLDRPESLSFLSDVLTDSVPAEFLLHCAPPALSGTRDERTRLLLSVLDSAVPKDLPKTSGILPRRVVYVSTSGVYGDCGGALVDESRPVNPGTDRARRRCDAEAVLTEWCAARGVALVILRVPGIYAADRLPLERLRKGTPVLRREDDVYTNHIHADDLAAICVRALDDSVPAGIYNASDDSDILMGDWLELVAERFDLPRPPRIPRSEAPGRIGAPMLSFMSESRRLVNARLKNVFGYVLRYPTVQDGLRAALGGKLPSPSVPLPEGEGRKALLPEGAGEKALLPRGEGLG